jgi:nicotinamide-nucleotide amidase
VPIATTILAVLGQIELHLTVKAPDRVTADGALDSAVRALSAALGESVYSVDGSSIEAVVGRMLKDRGLTIAAAESCTGGLLSSRLTDVPGSSDYVQSGVVCYSNRSKVEWLGVPETLIAEHGAVSEPVARAMASGVRSRAHASIGIGITGIAGPGGGTAEKPVGTVAIAVLWDDVAQVRTFQFIGGRDLVKFQASQAALNAVRLMLLSS